METTEHSALCIVMPAYNEEANIEQVARSWHTVVSGIGGGSRLVIFNDGSKDQTYNKLLSLQDELPLLTPVDKPNSGHGATVRYAYQYALDMGADYIFQTDSDGQTLPEEFSSFWEKRAGYAAIIGHRSRRQDGFSRVFVTKVLKLVILMIFRVSITDANTPFRLIPRATMQEYLPKIPMNFNLTNVLLSVLMADAKENVLYLPITFRPRQGGKNSINLRRIFRIGQKAVKDFRTIRKEQLKSHKK